MIQIPKTALNHHEFRQHLLDTLPDNSLVILSSGGEKIRSRDGYFPFRVNSDFHYLTGFNEPDTVLVLQKSTSICYTLFVRPKDKLREQWEGRRCGVAGAIEWYAADQAFNLDEISNKLPELMQNFDHLYYSFLDESVETLIKAAQQQLRLKSRAGIYPIGHVHDIDTILHQQRLIKTPAEIALMQQAADISVAAHLSAMATTIPGKYEYHLASAIHKIFEDHYATPAYTTIVGSGQNGCILHYTQNDCLLQKGDLVLIDAGAEYQGYCADITHTYPISGQWQGAQKALYEVVWQALQTATQQCLSGQPYDNFHTVAVKILTQGLIDLKLIKASLDQALAEKLYQRFYMHRTGHFLGRDVHDVGRYLNSQGQSILLENNMVVTVEPGLYIPDDDDIPDDFKGLAVRLEDNIVINNQSPINLTKALPRAPEKIIEYINQ